MSDPYRDEADTLRARAERAEKRLADLTARKPWPKWKGRVLTGSLAVAVMVHLFFCLLAHDGKDASPFHPWHPWIATWVAAGTVLVITIAFYVGEETP